jgi:hypothetical protein
MHGGVNMQQNAHVNPLVNRVMYLPLLLCAQLATNMLACSRQTSGSAQEFTATSNTCTQAYSSTGSLLMSTLPGCFGRWSTGHSEN